MCRLKTAVQRLSKLALAFTIVGFSSLSLAATPMKPGVYTQTVAGMQEGMVVEVTLSGQKIESINVIQSNETPGVAAAAIAVIPFAVTDNQSLLVDTVSGATMTSRGILLATQKAIIAAGGNPADFKTKKVKSTPVPQKPAPLIAGTDLPKKWDMTYDVVVVGGGFAGLSAAYSAQTHGAKTLLVEKMPFVGGNSQINGGVYASYTSQLAPDMQKKLSLPADTAQKHIEDTLKGGDNMSDPKLVKNLVYGSPVMLDLLLDNGLKVRESITRPGGHYGYRTYTLEHGQGYDIVEVQKKMLADVKVPIMTDAKMVKIYRDKALSGKVQGIGVETKDGFKTIKANKAVILASGGFSANVPMRSAQVPTLTSEVPTTNHVGATGEVITFAQEIGANTVQMSNIQLYPFANPNTGVLDAWAVIPFSGPSAGIVYVNTQGKRYVDEGERRDVNALAAQNSGGFPTFSIFDQEIVDKGGFISAEQLSSGMQADRILKADTLEGLVQEINKRTYKGQKVNMNPAALEQTIKTHNGYVKNGKDPDFGKTIDPGIMIPITKGPFYAVPQWPSVHHTMGGLAINEKTEVIDIYGNPIPGLLAAGEVAGGVHGTNRLGSNAIPDGLVHGYIAGQFAANGTLPDFTKGK